MEKVPLRLCIDLVVGPDLGSPEDLILELDLVGLRCDLPRSLKHPP